jgi:hypothetical protein
MNTDNSDDRIIVMCPSVVMLPIGMLAGIAMGIEQISRWLPRMRTST